MFGRYLFASGFPQSLTAAQLRCVICEDRWSYHPRTLSVPFLHMCSIQRWVWEDMHTALTAQRGDVEQQSEYILATRQSICKKMQSLPCIWICLSAVFPIIWWNFEKQIHQSPLKQIDLASPFLGHLSLGKLHKSPDFSFQGELPPLHRQRNGKQKAND